MFKHLTVDFKYETQKQSLKYSKSNSDYKKNNAKEISNSLICESSKILDIIGYLWYVVR